MVTQQQQKGSSIQLIVVVHTLKILNLQDFCPALFPFYRAQRGTPAFVRIYFTIYYINVGWPTNPQLSL
jgi:hypothetical protein